MSRASGRRALWRWSRRMIRREPSSTVLVVALLAVPVAFTTFAVVALSSTALIPDALMGAADHRVDLPPGETGQGARDALVEGFDGSLGAEAGDLRLPGRADHYPLYAIDMSHPMAAGFARMVDGRAPASPDEIAVHPGLARAAGVSLGDRIDAGGRPRTVVGLAENPSATDDQVGFVSPGSLAEVRGWFALIDAGGAPPERIAALVDGVGSSTQSRADYRDATIASLAVSLFGGLALAEVALVAAAAFTVSARRRQRDLALIATAGATPRQLRRAVLSGAAGLGVLGALAGAVVGLTASVAATGWLSDVGHRRLAGPVVPWLFVGGIALAAVLAATVAGWWPARAVARQSVMDALTAHRPAARRPWRSAGAGVVLVLAGTAISVAAYQAETTALTAVSIVAATLGVVLLAPFTVAGLGRAARHLPTSARVAARDLSRNRGRTAAGVAALVVALGFPLTIGFATASFDRYNRETFVAATPANVAVVTPGEPGSVPAGFDAATFDTPAALAQALPEARVAPMTVPVVGRIVGGSQPGYPIGVAMAPLGPPGSDGSVPIFTSALTVATPEVLAALDDPGLTAALDGHSLVSTDPRLADGTEPTLLTPDSIMLAGEEAPPRATAGQPAVDVEPIHRLPGAAAYDRSPSTFISAELATALGWDLAVSGWVVVADRPLDEAQLDTIAAIAARNGLEMAHAGAPSQATTARRAITAIGAANALAVVGIIVALTRAEARADDALLAAVGARPRARRHRAAATAGLTTLLGAVLALPASAIPLAGLLSRPEYDWVAPTDSLLAVLAGVPVLASATTWLVSRSQPAAGVRLT